MRSSMGFVDKNEISVFPWQYNAKTLYGPKGSPSGQPSNECEQIGDMTEVAQWPISRIPKSLAVPQHSFLSSSFLVYTCKWRRGSPNTSNITHVFPDTHKVGLLYPRLVTTSHANQPGPSFQLVNIISFCKQKIHSVQ